MNLLEALLQIREIIIPEKPHPVMKPILEELRREGNQSSVRNVPVELFHESPGVFIIGPVSAVKNGSANPAGYKLMPGELSVRIDEDGSGHLLFSETFNLYGFVRHLLEDLACENVKYFIAGRRFTPAFRWQRIVYDFFLTQEGRIQKDLNPETYIRELARLGFSHVEVNGLAAPCGLETGPSGEAYPMFYTYCPALDQFTSSNLNRGLYPEEVLAANLDVLKRNARLAVEYGLVPVLLCFEPRSVPERFFEKFPMLRGARVDHPFRSFKPRYNMTIAHPAVRDHYAEMVQNLLKEVPELGALSIWTNDSGAGFEHTKSLYVGRNGGPYLIREWKDDTEIAKTAGENALRFFYILRDAGRQINPDFRILTRMESFYGEHETVWDGLENGVDVETASLAARGWDPIYTHPAYPESKTIQPGTVYQDGFDAREQELLDDVHQHGAEAHFYFSAGPHTLFAPLMGIPYPHLTHRRLKQFHDNGVRFLAHTGGTFPPELVPFNVNHQIVRRFNFEPELDIDICVLDLARRWAGDSLAETLIEAWRSTEKAILAFPIVTPLYTTFGFTWYRLWARPLVPDIEALPEVERAYYEKYMCTTPHNPNNIDLSRDVLFELTTPEACELCIQRIDEHLTQPMDRAVTLLEEAGKTGADRLGPMNIVADQAVRLRALRCWFATQRNVAGWIAGVHGALNTAHSTAYQKYRTTLRESIQNEIENTRTLHDLLESDIAFMAMTDLEETPLIHGTNLRALLDKRLHLMESHIDDEPRIDPNYTMRKAAESGPVNLAES